MQNRICDHCDEEFSWDDSDEFIGCDTVDGQYIEYLAVICTNCECINQFI